MVSRIKINFGIPWIVVAVMGFLLTGCTQPYSAPIVSLADQQAPSAPVVPVVSAPAAVAPAPVAAVPVKKASKPAVKPAKVSAKTPTKAKTKTASRSSVKAKSKTTEPALAHTPVQDTTTTLQTVAVQIVPRTVDGIQWQWPVTMPAPYQASANTGLDIAAKTGSPIFAAAAGTVEYVGPGVQGYGDMIMVQQNDTYLTVYANVGHSFVKQGDTVTLGQNIALLGESPDNKALLHFEIRKNSTPISPLKMLPKI